MPGEPCSGVAIPQATELRWYPSLFRALLLVGDNSPEDPTARLRMCGVEEDRRSSPMVFVLEGRLFLIDCWWV